MQDIFVLIETPRRLMAFCSEAKLLAIGKTLGVGRMMLTFDLAKLIHRALQKDSKTNSCAAKEDGVHDLDAFIQLEST